MVIVVARTSKVPAALNPSRKCRSASCSVRAAWDRYSATHAVLRRTLPSYTNQIAKALLRRDPVSVNHRLAALLASYFDILFALNRELHPGEKRLLEFASRCALQPEEMARDIGEVLGGASEPKASFERDLHRLIDRLDTLLAEHGLV